MSEKKVKVLLSAYNGESYIKAQLDSILGQSYHNIEIYVRDDGSTDGTLSILKEYQSKAHIQLIEGENIGFIRSFLKLIESSGEADYYAYADQDDVWMPGKIRKAVETINKEDKSKPILYFANYDFYDSNMEFSGHHESPSILPSFQNALVDCMPLGISSVFNRRACELIRKNMPENCCGHDWWTYMLCAGLGKVIYDNKVTVKYRRHEANVSAGGMNFLQFQIWRFKKFFVNDYFSNVRKQTKEFASYYEEMLKTEDKKLLRMFTKDKYQFHIALKKALYKHRYRMRMLDECMVRCLFLIGKL